MFERADDGASDTRKKVGVLVRIDVRELQSGALQLLDLCEGLAFDLILADGATQDAEGEAAE